ncbi:MAG: hypothetical protein A3H97_08120 [Acidobacteria bacterium RIFCSPLOWO2_02_FULL_65_29]|nr:MAG: hypothetical protein A3H97_08120 [Acidobacteria bacterium RIFCSPLOWO2_02_FULL_65_29]
MAPERNPGGFGGTLREARERKGVSLRQIANTTKISMSALEALERNDISRLPGGIFSRAFVRAYAGEVGLEPEETIRDFIAHFPNDSVTAGHPNAARIEDSEALDSDRRMAATILRLVAVALPIAGIVLYFGMFGGRALDDQAEQRPAVPARAAADTLPISAHAFEAPPTAPPPAPTFPADRLTVGVSATALCWVSAIVDGQRVLARLLQAGERQELDVRRELVLTAGDAGGLVLTLNGAAARPLGRSGQVITTRLTLANFKDHLAAP